LHHHSVYEGTGMGLAVCRKIVERHGGSLTAHSTPGQGATFLVTLPVLHPKGEHALCINVDNPSLS
jgi:signal transduction histidine kinase